MSRKVKKAEKNETSIAYRGVVNVTVKKGKKIVSKQTCHNSSTNLLFRTLCYTLTGSELYKDIPEYIDAGTRSEGTFSSQISPRCKITSRTVEVNSGAYSAVFTATLTYNQAPNKSISSLQLCTDSSGVNVIAKLDLDNEIKLDSSAYSAVLTWKMTFIDDVGGNN